MPDYGTPENAPLIVRRPSYASRAINILAVVVNVLTLPSLLLVAKQGTPAWFLLVQAWLLIVLTVITVRAFAIEKERAAEHEVVLSMDRLEEASVRYHDAFHLLRDSMYQMSERYLASGTLGHIDETELQDRLANALSRLADFYSIQTGRSCHVTIKQLIATEGDSIDPNDLNVISYARSHPEGVRPEFHSVKLNLNSDFMQIINDGRRYFISNDLQKESHYRNPTIEMPPRYLSTIVWPIRRGVASPSLNAGSPNLLGFLAIDTKEAGTFRDPLHVFLGAAFADSLFTVLNIFSVLSKAVVADEGSDEEAENEDRRGESSDGSGGGGGPSDPTWETEKLASADPTDGSVSEAHSDDVGVETLSGADDREETRSDGDGADG